MSNETQRQRFEVRRLVQEEEPLPFAGRRSTRHPFLQFYVLLEEEGGSGG